MYVCYKFFIINRYNPIRVVIRMGVLTPYIGALLNKNKFEGALF